jgi:hypothetical protein
MEEVVELVPLLSLVRQSVVALRPIHQEESLRSSG